MTDQKNHLENAIAQQKELISEIEDLNRQVSIKRENAIKLQGIIEYLTSLTNSADLPDIKENSAE